jgi:hypothetical protein
MIVSESATVSGFIPLGKHILPLCAITYDAVFSSTVLAFSTRACRQTSINACSKESAIGYRLPPVDYRVCPNSQSPPLWLSSDDTGIRYTFRVMANTLGLAAEAVVARTVFIAGSILLLPILLTICFGWVVLHSSPREQIKKWLVWRGFGRFVLPATVAAWWVTWDLGGRSDIPGTLVRRFSATWWDRSSVEALLFWLLPVASLGLFLVTCYVVDRTVLKQRWSFVALLRRAWWRLVSFVIPLLMVASGFTLIFSGKIVGTVWLITAGIVSRVGTRFLTRAEGMKFNRRKSGELRNRALKMADHMGVIISRVYIVPAGKGHLTNAYG